MITRISFKVELDYLAAQRGLDHCVEVECHYDVSFSYDRFDTPDIHLQWATLKSVIDEDGNEIMQSLSAIDLDQIDKEKDYYIDRHDFYDDYISAQEAKAESMIGDR